MKKAISRSTLSAASSITLSASQTSIPRPQSRYLKTLARTPLRKSIHLITFLSVVTLLLSETLFIPKAPHSAQPAPVPRVARAGHPRLHGLQLHPVAMLVHKLILQYNITKVLDHPCRAHRDIIPPLLRVLHIRGHLRSLSYTCADPDSGQLSRSHAAIRESVPEFPARYVRLNATLAGVSARAGLVLALRAPEGISALVVARAAGANLALVGVAEDNVVPFEYAVLQAEAVEDTLAVVYDVTALREDDVPSR